MALAVLFSGGLVLLLTGMLFVRALMLGAVRGKLDARLNGGQEAAALIERDGDKAYATAREFSRTLMEAGKWDLARYWSEVALIIADKQGRVMGEGAPERSERDARR